MKTIAMALVVCAAALAAANEMRPEAKAHYDRGVRHMTAHEYAPAIAELKAGYAIDARPEFLFSLAQAQRLGGDCASAIGSYRAFLATKPSERSAFAARTNLERCESEVRLAEAKAARDAETARAAALERERAELARQAIANRPKKIPWYRDVLGGALAGAGLAAIAVGGGVLGGGNARIDEANRSMDYAQFASRADAGETGERMRIAGAVVLSVGGALVIGGVVRYALRAHSSKQ